MAEKDVSESLGHIRRGLADAEAAIQQHPSATIAVYASNVDTFGRQSFDWALSAVPALTVEDAQAVDRYMLAMSFMSAWYHLHGNKAARDVAAQSAATLVSGVGFESMFAFKAMLHYESEWKRALSAAGIGTRSGAGCAGVLLLLLASGATGLLVLI